MNKHALLKSAGAAAGLLLAVVAGFAAPAPQPTAPVKPVVKAPVQPTAAPPAAAADAPALTPEQTTFFESKIRPLFVQHCYKCHSLEQGKSKGSLTLDTKAGWQKGGDTGTAIVPGDPEKSLLIKAIRYTDAELQMPPKGDRLSAQQVADLMAWVKMGAPDPRSGAAVAKLTGLTEKARSHWAYQPVKPQTVPQVKDKNWSANPVDAFILTKLEQNGLTPSKQASREVLIRRATYDLIGLPPTPEEVKAFVYDRSPNAFEKVVDRLLASPHYGERWGRYWLDTARYSDTTGNIDSKNEDYRYTYAWTYRDYVIRAVNEDRPYNQFLLEQIAADQLPEAQKDPSRLAALGFLTVGKRFQNPNDTLDERIDTVSKATMAMTVACARCHDHKFDPVPTADYYSLHGIFASTVEPEDKPMASPASGPEVADYQKKMAALEAKNREIYFDVLAEQSAEFREKAAGYILTSLYNGGQHKDPQKKLAAVREFGLTDKGNGQLQTKAQVKKESPVFAPMRWFADLGDDGMAAGVSEVLQRIAKSDANTVNPRVAAAFKAVSPSSLKTVHDVAEVYGKLFASIESKAKAYIAANRAATGSSVDGYDAALVQLIDTPFKVEPAPVMTMAHIREIFTKLALGEGAYSRFAFNDINTLELTHPGAPGKAMVVADAPKPKDSPIFIRGDAQMKGRLVPRQFLEILSGASRKAFQQGSGRLELAQAIASKDNPLTARVMVNRIWLHHFGEGFVRTPDDLGVQSEPPSHPELLDYLAGRFVQDGWSLKKMHKLIMLSNTYQQSSDTNLKFAQKDPYNRLLWRANLRRLDFEAIRDSLLQFSGKLDRTIGGKPVNLTDEPYSNRRSVYGYIDRGNLPELMAQFDFGDPNRPNSRRATTIVPQQALFLMNSPMSADVARKVCSRPEFRNARDDYSRVRALYEVLYQRDARPTEVRFAADFYNAHILRTAPKGKAAVAAGPKEAPKENKPTGGKSAIQNEGAAVERTPLTIWEQYAQALLFSNELAYVN